MVAGAGDDLMDGGLGDDVLRGGPGADRMLGGDGADLMVGSTGDDVMDGGLGADLFIFDPSRADEGADTVFGVDVTEDRIQLNGESVIVATTDVDLAGALTAEEIAAGMDASTLWTLGAATNGAALLTHPGGSVTLADVAATDLPVATFAGLVEAGALVIDTAGLVPEDGGAVA
jgi:Ca2+-binding RTX toxin-like protein